MYDKLQLVSFSIRIGAITDGKSVKLKLNLQFMSEDRERRERVRALVRAALANAEPAAPSGDVPPTIGKPEPNSPFVNVAPTPVAPPAFDRDESSKAVITEDDLRGLPEGAKLRVAEGARLTPSAADIVRERRIELIRRAPRRGSRASKTVAVGADHGGFPMKEELKQFLTELGHQVRDFGTNSESAVDYPDFAHAVAQAVADGQVELGIVIDGAGVGSAMTANKVPGVRAAACYSVAVAKNSREHNDANVLSLGSKTISSKEMREIVEAWLNTEISEDRHRKRVAKITAIERQYTS